MSAQFTELYKKLNPAQKEAVDTIDGPVMVVAGPGTGKTQILTLRIANILDKTDTKADGILCLTFTNSAVSEMRKRLQKYIGAEGGKVEVSTFHSYGLKIIEENYSLLNLDSPPKLLDEKDGVTMCDEILHNNDWEYIRPRSDSTRYFRDLRSLISLLKRERISPDAFRQEIKINIKKLENDPESISSRGKTKGELKVEVVKKIEGFSRTLEVVKFFELYEEAKKSSNFMDYDDVLENLVRVVEISEDLASSIREQYLYILIDEHQDSSGVQNDFLQKVWGSVDKPNIFVVGDDRQLIYGFGGASLAYFEGFKNTFGKAKLITLVENYRSTQVILDASHELLKSKVVSDKLKSQNKDTHPIHLIETEYPRDEIIACGIEIKQKIKEGIDPNHIALLVPKNRQVRSAVLILRDMGIPVSAKEGDDFFNTQESQALLRVLKIVANPYDSVAIAESLFDKFSDIPPILAHKFARENIRKDFSLEVSGKQGLFNDNPVEFWFNKLRTWLEYSKEANFYELIQRVANEFLLSTAKNHDDLMRRIEVIRTLLHLVLSKKEKTPKITLKDFMIFLDRLESYGEHIPLAVFGADEGVKVLTLHGSKGQEFDFVWIAHMDEKSLMSGKKQGFTLPDSTQEKMEKKDIETAKRELYVAITRAKRFCTISYALNSYTGTGLELAQIISDLPPNIFTKQSSSETEKKIIAYNPKVYSGEGKFEKEFVGIKELVSLVAKEYEETKVSSTLLNNFFECPWKWYFRSFLKLPEEKSESLEHGDKVHKAIDKILKMKSNPTEKELKELSQGDKDILKIITKWVKDRLPEISKDRENEQSVSMSDDRFPHLNIYGKIDLIEKLGEEEVRVTDFKTGSTKKKSEIEKMTEEGRLSNLMRQLAMYSYLLEQSPKWKVSVTESQLEFLEAKGEKDAFYSTKIDPGQIKLLVKDISDYDGFLKNGEWVTRECHYNSYGKNTECEYCKMAEIYKI